MDSVRKTIPLRLAAAPRNADQAPRTDVALLAEAIAACRRQAVPEDVLRLLERYLASSRRLVFKEAVRAADGRPQWTVTGANGREITFASKRVGMRLLHRLARGEELEGDEGVRLQIKRALRELSRFSPEVAAELLRGFSVSGWTARYQPDARSPAIDT